MSNGPGPGRVVLSVIWATAPIYTMGLATPFVIGYAAARLRSRGAGLAGAGYGALWIITFVVAGSVPQDDWRLDLVMYPWFAAMILGGTVHAFFLREAILRERGTAPPGRQGAAPTWNPWLSSAQYPGPPPTVGPYTLLRRIGAGSQGTVHLAQGPDGRQVALKTLKERLTGGPVEHERFRREVMVARRVPPFATVPVLDAGVAGDMAYIVSEYVPGPSLDRLVRERGPLAEGGLTRLAVATAAALNGIHGAGVVHRDFKPGNILLGPDGPRVIDFGIAKALDSLVTTTAAIKGTPAFMSPEQVSERPVGPPSDVFSWAATMIYAATGRGPFSGTTFYALAEQILTAEPDVTVLPGPLREPTAACLSKDPARRPAAAELMLAITR